MIKINLVAALITPYELRDYFHWSALTTGRVVLGAAHMRKFSYKFPKNPGARFAFAVESPVKLRSQRTCVELTLNLP